MARIGSTDAAIVESPAETGLFAKVELTAAVSMSTPGMTSISAKARPMKRPSAASPRSVLALAASTSACTQSAINCMLASPKLIARARMAFTSEILPSMSCSVRKISSQ